MKAAPIRPTAVVFGAQPDRGRGHLKVAGDVDCSKFPRFASHTASPAPGPTVAPRRQRSTHPLPITAPITPASPVKRALRAFRSQRPPHPPCREQALRVGVRTSCRQHTSLRVLPAVKPPRTPWHSRITSTFFRAHPLPTSVQPAIRHVTIGCSTIPSRPGSNIAPTTIRPPFDHLSISSTQSIHLSPFRIPPILQRPVHPFSPTALLLALRSL